MCEFKNVGHLWDPSAPGRTAFKVLYGTVWDRHIPVMAHNLLAFKYVACTVSLCHINL